MNSTSENLTPCISPAMSSANSPRIFNDVFMATHERLAAEFQPKSPAIEHWLDPDGGLAMPPEDLLNGPVSDELPAIYERFKSIEPGLDWRRLAAEVMLGNTDVDNRLQRSLQSSVVSLPHARLPLEFSGLTHYAQPLPAPFLSEINVATPSGIQWCVYLLPEILKSKAAKSIAVQAISRRALDFREFESRQYKAIQPHLAMPPLLVMRAPGGGEDKPWVLLEGLYRCVRAQEEGLDYVPCREVRWEHLRPYLHQRPFKGLAKYYEVN